MAESIFKPKNDKAESAENVIRQLDGQYAKMSLELEKLVGLKQKIDKIDSKLREVEDIINRGGFKLQTHAISSKTSEAIKLILQNHGELTSSQLSKLIKLSRTRCNEYMKQMEVDGELGSRIDCRKKLYKIRQ
ncbi:MAG TPA: winged helix-turn-helix domain-containing protein [archaeon]|nr:winged helix-turn-helix domain-containing protein [archaeon]